MACMINLGPQYFSMGTDLDINDTGCIVHLVRWGILFTQGACSCDNSNKLLNAEHTAAQECSVAKWHVKQEIL